MVSPPKKAPFLVERQEAVLVKPSAPSPSGLLSLSTLDNDPNLDLICQSVYVYSAEGEPPAAAAIKINGGGEQQQRSRDDDVWRSDPASAVKEGLSKALAYYYPLAGRLRRHDQDGRFRVDCTGEGVPFSAATAACTLASINYVEGLDLVEAKQLVLRAEGADSGVNVGLPVMMQVTRFACGGFTVGLGLSHVVCDGFGSAQFLRAVAELAGGASEPSVKPVWARERLVAGAPADWSAQPQPVVDEKIMMGPRGATTSPHLPSDDLVNGSFDVDAATIGRLKRALQEEEEKEETYGAGEAAGTGFTALEALGAYLWRSRFRALEMDAEGTTHFALAVGIRRDAMCPPLPKGYYGNAFVGAHAFLRGGELCDVPLWRAAAAIRESKRKAQEAAYVAPYLGFMEGFLRAGGEKVGGEGSSLVVTDWRHMGLAAAEFGGRLPVHVLPLPWDMFGNVDLCILLPPFSLDDPSMRGGVRALLCLPRASMARFEEEMAAL